MKMNTQKASPKELISDLDLSRYHGQAGDLIRLCTTGEHEALLVIGVIRDILGVVHETGIASWDSQNHCWWYMAQMTLDVTVIVTIVAQTKTGGRYGCAIAAWIPEHIRFPASFNELLRTTSWIQN